LGGECAGGGGGGEAGGEQAFGRIDRTIAIRRGIIGIMIGIGIGIGIDIVIKHRIGGDWERVRNV